MKTILFFSFVFLYSTLSHGQDLPVSEQEMMKWGFYLADDKMKGRANGSPEMEEAARFIATEFEKAGLQTHPKLDSYFQSYTFSSRRSGEIDERNVVGFLEGSDPELKKEYVVVTAHFDHVGVRRPVNGDSIYNGANDNAAGTITIMGLAHAWNRQGIQPKRSVLFVAFSGEEMGMHGSRYFVSNPIIPLDKIHLNINIEMTGHCTLLGPQRFYLTGPSFSDFDEIVDEYNQDHVWKRVDTVSNADRLFFASDNAAFATKGGRQHRELHIPGFTFCTHGGEDHIHRPHDEPQFMDYANMAGFVNYLSGLALYLANKPEPVEWDHEAFDNLFK